MADLPETFVSQFHHISGDSIRERHQSFFKLLRQHSELSKNDAALDKICSNLTPTTHLEKILYIDFLIYFRRSKELYSEFVEGNVIAISKLAKHNWFFQNAFNEVSAEDFVSNVLPSMGYNVRLKVLKKLALSEQQSDDIFNAIQKQYGLQLATVILPRCSAVRIREVLKTYFVKLTPSQLKLLLKKDSELLMTYFEERSKHEGGSSFMDANPVLICIAQEKPELFSRLFKKFKFDVKLGHRTTKNFIKFQKNQVLDEKARYIKVLNKDSFVRKLGKELSDLFFIKDVNSDCYWKRILKHYPRKYQFDIFREKYNSVYFSKFGEDPDKIDEEVLKIIPNVDEREKFAKLKFKKDEHHDYYKYITPKHSLQLFLDGLKQLSLAERAIYVGLITECCILSKDTEAALKLFEIVAVRFKNDDRRIRFEFICAICQDKTFFKGFTEQHWKYLYEILSVMKVKNEDCYSDYSVRWHCLKFFFENGKPYESLIAKYDDWASDFRFEFFDDPLVMRKLICKLVELGYLKQTEDTESGILNYDCSLVNLCKNFNLKYPNLKINIFDNPRICDSLKKVLREGIPQHLWEIPLVNAVNEFICQKEPSEDLTVFHKLYFEKFKVFGRLKACLWFLKYNPKVLQENLDQFLQNHINVWSINQKRLWLLLKRYSHLELDERTADFCRLKLREGNYEEKKHLIKPLTILSRLDAHIQFMQAYLPNTAKIDLTEVKNEELYTIQNGLVKLMHLKDAPEAIVPLTLEFCKGDYLQSALSPLYSSVYRLPAQKAQLVIEKLNENKAISVKKHAIILNCVIGNTKTVSHSLTYATVPSLKNTLNYFVRNQSEEIWELLEQKILETEDADLDVFKVLLDVPMPFSYKAKFVEILWSVFDKFEKDHLKRILIKQVEKNVIKQLRPQVAAEIIKNCMFKMEEANSFIAYLLIYLEDSSIFEVFKDIILKFKETNWNNHQTGRSSRSKLSKFINTLVVTYVDLDEFHSNFVTQLLDGFSAVFTLQEAFGESVMISLAALKGETKESSAKLLTDLSYKFGSLHGTLGRTIFADVASKTILPRLFQTDNERVQVCHHLLKLVKVPEDYLLIFSLLPRAEPDLLEYYELFVEILNALQQADDHQVQLLLNLYLKLEPTEYF